MRNPARRTKLLLALLLLAGVLSVSEDGWTRVGGGHSYSGSGSSSRGSGGSFSGSHSGDLDVGLLIELGFRLIVWSFQHPKVGIPLLLILLAVVYFATREQRISTLSASIQHTLDAEALKSSISRNGLRKLRQTYDPTFSIPAFFDFSTQLFTTLHQARGARKLEDYSLFLSEAAQRSLEQLSSAVRGVQGVLVGSIELTEAVIIPQSQTARIDVTFEANYTETLPTGTQSFYTQETWSFVRSLRAQSPTPEKIRSILCPSCGATPSAENGRCRACGSVINTGQFTWMVQSIQTKKRESRPPLLTSATPEVGTDLPTVYDPEFGVRRDELQKLGPTFDLAHFQKRAAEIFLALQTAWSTRNWALARPFETDNLFQSHAYWIQEYRKQKLINRMDQVKIHSITPVRIEMDSFYVALTARISAQAIDTTVDEAGKPVCGDANRPRRFTEYWTFLRSKDATPPKAGSNACPSCGAELKISQAGHCEFCDARVTSGKFDWVASLIEQDEAYHG